MNTVTNKDLSSVQEGGKNQQVTNRKYQLYNLLFAGRISLEEYLKRIKQLEK